jgi:hypothetical protein
MANPLPDVRINDLSVSIDNTVYCIDLQQTYVRLFRTRAKSSKPIDTSVAGGPMGRL